MLWRVHQQLMQLGHRGAEEWQSAQLAGEQAHQGGRKRHWGSGRKPLGASA